MIDSPQPNIAEGKYYYLWNKITRMKRLLRLNRKDLFLPMTSYEVYGH